MWSRLIPCVLILNVASAVLAVPVMLGWFGIFEGLESSLRLDLPFGHTSYDGMISLSLAYAATTLVNAGVEGWLLIRLWKVPSDKRPFMWWLIANGVSNGLVFVALMVWMLPSRH